MRTLYLDRMYWSSMVGTAHHVQLLPAGCFMLNRKEEKREEEFGKDGDRACEEEEEEMVCSTGGAVPPSVP